MQRLIKKGEKKMEKLIKTLFKACFAVWFLIAFLSLVVILPCLKEIFHATERQVNMVCLFVVLWILVPITLYAAIGGSLPEKERVHGIKK